MSVAGPKGGRQPHEYPDICPKENRCVDGPEGLALPSSPAQGLGFLLALVYGIFLWLDLFYLSCCSISLKQQGRGR